DPSNPGLSLVGVPCGRRPSPSGVRAARPGSPVPCGGVMTRSRKWLPLFPSTRARRSRRTRDNYGPHLQHLEDRPVPATLTVNTTLDTVDVTPGDGLARDNSGNTSLRAAVMEANALAGADTIILPPGTYFLARAGANENAGATGDLDVTDNLTVQGSVTAVS